MYVPTLEIRNPTFNDIPEAIEFVNLALQDPTLLPDCSEFIGASLITNLETKPQNFLVAIDKYNNDFIIGFLEINPDQSEVNKYFCITRIYVLPQFDKQEIASALVQRLLEEKCINGEELIVQVCNECERKYYEDLHFLAKSSVLSMKL